MNNKESELHRIIQIVVDCCATQIDENGTMSITKEEVLSKSRKENVIMTRCIIVHQIINAGYSVTTCSQILNRTIPAIRHLYSLGTNYLKISRAYRIAHAEATLKCKDIQASKI